MIVRPPKSGPADTTAVDFLDFYTSVLPKILAANATDGVELCPILQVDALVGFEKDITHLDGHKVAVGSKVRPSQTSPKHFRGRQECDFGSCFQQLVSYKFRPGVGRRFAKRLIVAEHLLVGLDFFVIHTGVEHLSMFGVCRE